MRLPPPGAGPFAMLCTILIVLPMHVHAQSAVDGWTLTVAFTSDSGPGTKQHVSKLRHRFAGRRLRIDEAPDAAPRGQAASLPYFIIDDSAHTRATVEPRLRRVSMSAEPAESSRAIHDFGFEFMGNPRLRIEDRGPGEPILGHPTRAYRVSVFFVSRQILRGKPCRRTTDTVEELWAASDVPRVDLLRSYVHDFPPAPPDLHGPVIDTLRKFDELREKTIGGFILRSIVTTRRPARDGSRVVLRSRMDVTELTLGPMPRSLFDVPSSFSTGAPAERLAAESSMMRLTMSPAEVEKLDSVIADGMRRLICDPGPGDP